MISMEEILEVTQEKQIPQNTIDSIRNYADLGLPPGGFITAFLANDLMEALGRADHMNIQCFKEIATYVYNEIPANCHGSYEIVDDWLKNKR